MKNNIFNVVMNVKGKTKDNDKTRKNLTLYYKKPYLDLKLQSNGNFLKPKPNYTLTTKELKLVYH